MSDFGAAEIYREAIDELSAERDRLRAIFEADPNRLRAMVDELETERDDLLVVQAERDRLRAVVARLWDTLTAVHSYAADPVGLTDLNGVAWLTDPERLPPEIRALADDVLEQTLDQLDGNGDIDAEREGRSLVARVEMPDAEMERQTYGDAGEVER